MITSLAPNRDPEESHFEGTAIYRHTETTSFCSGRVLFAHGGERDHCLFLPELYKCKLLILLFATKTGVACCSQLPLYGGEE